MIKKLKLQTSLDNEKKKVQKRDELNALYKARKGELANEKIQLQSELDKKNADVQKARDNYITEADGSGGTGKVGIKDIALAKKKEYEKSDAEYKEVLAAGKPKINDIDAQLKEIQENVTKEQQLFTNYFNNGFLTRK